MERVKGDCPLHQEASSDSGPPRPELQFTERPPPPSPEFSLGRICGPWPPWPLPLEDADASAGFIKDLLTRCLSDLGYRSSSRQG